MQLTLKLSFLTVRFEEIPELSGGLVRFFSVKLGSDDVMEFEKFDELEFSSQGHRKEQQIIYATIEEIKSRGAKEIYFKPEGGAKALPKIKELSIENPDDFGIRLYCILINENAVVLLNGGIKTSLDPKSCPNVKTHFSRALKIADKLKKAMDNDYIQLTENGIEIDEGFDFDI